jgi:hypothetical protein
MDRAKRRVERYLADLDEADRLEDGLAESDEPPASLKDKIALLRQLMASPKAPAPAQPRRRKVR